MVTGQSLVLYSRLHFVMHRPKLLRYVLAMIVANAIWLGIPVIVLVCGSSSTKPDAFEPVYAVFEKVQLSVFTVQELVLSGLYIIETTRILKVQKGLAPAGPRRVMGYLYSSTSLLCFSTVKLKVEFGVLNRLVEFSQHLKTGSSLPPMTCNTGTDLALKSCTTSAPVTPTAASYSVNATSLGYSRCLAANMSQFIDVNLLAAATNAHHVPNLLGNVAASLLSYDSTFHDVLGRNATARMVWDLPWEAFHESGVYNKRDDSLYITSNYKNGENINITVVSLGSDDYPFHSTRFPGLAMANGGSSYYPPGHDRHGTPPLHVYCDEGDFEHDSQLVAVDPNTKQSRPLLTNFLGRNFSSINDVRQHPVTGDLWFTDADYGYFQHFRPRPSMPRQVYRFEPATGVVQVVADGFVQPNGIEFSPDNGVLYVSDTGGQQLDVVPGLPATIYAFDVVDDRRLAHRRVFAFADVGFPDGVHCDTRGNVWAAVGDGVHIWNPDGVLLGKIYIGETSNNFAFAPGKVFVFSNRRLWVVENVNAQGREVCKDFGCS
ncbi:hypothetical protein G6O67_006607 [Ophiocordyceps sinensis]|uniref:SMP-30/Gluconolactonase/LRE-like region domain-containing protein n=1 Tax=Ophiocordyceps sinensis TaxID=72228 RepID=A0A8H4PMY3_9HYPO|nr:hypothetical protein G6O67_006607 [Ophiocordyceps sinensis]